MSFDEPGTRIVSSKFSGMVILLDNRPTRTQVYTKTSGLLQGERGGGGREEERPG